MVVSACYGAEYTTAFPSFRRLIQIIAPGPCHSCLQEKTEDLNGITSVNAGLSYNNYVCLVAMASWNFCFATPVILRTIILNASFGPYPWIFWVEIHRGYTPRSPYLQGRVRHGAPPSTLQVRDKSIGRHRLRLPLLRFVGIHKRSKEELSPSGLLDCIGSRAYPVHRSAPLSSFRSESRLHNTTTGLGSDSELLADKLSTKVHKLDFEA